MKQHVIFDTELIGTNNPVFLICTKVVETGEQNAFWFHKRGHMKRFKAMLDNKDYTWVGFNSENFDRPLIAAAMLGCTTLDLKMVATAIIGDDNDPDDKGMRSWQTYKEFEIDFIEYDHIDLIETAPGVMISLKTYAGRMGYKTMVDMPFHHTTDLKPSQLKTVEEYCFNDVGVTEELFKRLKDELALRVQLSAEHGIDMRSKSDAQIAEAILKKAASIDKRSFGGVPRSVRYKTPAFIKTKSETINELITTLEDTLFAINFKNGSPVLPEYLEEPIPLGHGTYQFGLGGLHSTHDNKLYLQATEDRLVSDFDVASYYPNIMTVAGIVPNLGGKRGELFLAAYKHIYEQRMAAKHAGNKKVANSLKITLNGTFGKLGSIYCPFYAPDLLIAVTLTGQLNLMCLIYELDKIKGVKCESANTDGIVVSYGVDQRSKVLDVFSRNSKRTGFIYEETQYAKYAAKDVNNYIAVKTNGEVKTKGLYASNHPEINPLYLMKNPTMEVCSKMAIEYIKDGLHIDPRRHTDVRDFMSIRNVKGGGVQHKKIIELDDWEQIPDGDGFVWVHPCMTTKPVVRKSRPKPRQVGVGGVPFGRVARWYMSTNGRPAITSMGNEVTGVRNGGQVAKTEGAQLCMTLPDSMPKDIDEAWYVIETEEILRNLGVL